MKRRQFLRAQVVASCLAALTGCYSSADSSTTASTPTSTGPTPSASTQFNSTQAVRSVADMFGGTEAMTLLQEADKIEAIRLKDSEYEETPDKYKTVGNAIAVDRDMAQKFAKILSDHNSYDWSGAMKGCIPIYGVQLRFTKGKSTLDVVFCFHCDILVTYIDGKAAGNASFDNSHDALARLVLELFPKDQGIQSIRLHDADARGIPSTTDNSVRRRIKL